RAQGLARPASGLGVADGFPRRRRTDRLAGRERPGRSRIPRRRSPVGATGRSALRSADRALRRALRKTGARDDRRRFLDSRRSALRAGSGRASTRDRRRASGGPQRRRGPRAPLGRFPHLLGRNRVVFEEEGASGRRDLHAERRLVQARRRMVQPPGRGRNTVLAGGPEPPGVYEPPSFAAAGRGRRDTRGEGVRGDDGGWVVSVRTVAAGGGSVSFSTEPARIPSFSANPPAISRT